MGTALKEFYSSVIEPIRELESLEEARRRMNMLAEEYEYIESQAKGMDIGRKVIEGLNKLGRAPDYSPIFSLEVELEKLEAFLGQFGVNSLGDISDSVVMALSNCVSDQEIVTSFSELTEREREFGGVKFPAVRINFVPQEY